MLNVLPSDCFQKAKKMYSPLNCYHDKTQPLVCRGKNLHMTKNLIKWFY